MRRRHKKRVGFAAMKENFGLYMVMTDPVVGYEACAQAAVNCGLRYVQLRIKNASRAAILSEAKKVRTVTAGTGTLFIMNDDVELAWASGADGVHLGQGDMPLDEARKLWNEPGKIFGLSTHSEAQELAARALNPDYIGVGPVFPTPTKVIADPALGIERAGMIIKNSPLTCVALGGLDETNLAAVLKAGAVNFCAVRAIMRSPEPVKVIRALQQIGCAVGG
jgi:thiamine-phosphate pyrophosphorylase